ncbi:MAG: metal ABC transporter substrate-binding protein [Cyanobacteria bacterium J06633_1]
MFRFNLYKNRVKYFLGIAMAGVTASAVVGNIKINGSIAQANDKPKIVASHNIICDLVQTIAQDTIDLTCLIDANQDPHTYRPTPGDRRAIESAQLIFYGGYELEPQIAELLSGIETPKLALYEQAVSEPLLAEHEHGEHEGHEEHEEHAGHEGHEGHEHEEDEEHESAAKPSAESVPSQPELEPDPHVWHDIENTVKIVDLVKSIFLQVNPAVAEIYLANSASLTEELWQLDAWIDNQIDTIPAGQRVLVTTHGSFNYYVRAYYLEDYKTLQGLSSASSPTAAQLGELASEIEQAGISTIFAESTTSDRVLRNVARAADVKLSEQPLYADGLGAAGNYIEMMSHNTCTIVDGLGGECKPFESGE